MSEKRKYQLFISMALGMFVYLCTTEVYDRWESAFVRWTDLDSRENLITNSGGLAERKTALVSMKKRLLAHAMDSFGRLDQSEIGLYEYLNRKARENGFRYQSVEPGQVDRQGEAKHVAFRLYFATEYVSCGKWLAAVESGSIPVRITNLEVSTDNVFSGKLTVAISGSASLYPNAPN